MNTVRFDFTPDEAQRVARIVCKDLEAHGWKVAVETSPWNDALYTTTIMAQRRKSLVLVEAQGRFEYHSLLVAFALWVAARRYNAEFSIAVSHDESPSLGTLQALRRDGVGLLTVLEDESISTVIQARNPALMALPNPSLAFGQLKTEVGEAQRVFNDDCNRIGGVRSMCELVERETDRLGVIAIRKGKLTRKTEAEFQLLSWNDQINILTGVLPAKLKDDLHSFRGARNLVDHPPKNKREAATRDLQLVERMMMAYRLVAELLSEQRKLRK